MIQDGPAAAAGLKVGDKIQSIDGRPVSQLSLPAVRLRFKSDAPGTKLHLTVQSGGSTREIDLILKDLA